MQPQRCTCGSLLPHMHMFDNNPYASPMPNATAPISHLRPCAARAARCLASASSPSWEAVSTLPSGPTCVPAAAACAASAWPAATGAPGGRLDAAIIGWPGGSDGTTCGACALTAAALRDMAAASVSGEIGGRPERQDTALHQDCSSHHKSVEPHNEAGSGTSQRGTSSPTHHRISSVRDRTLHTLRGLCQSRSDLCRKACSGGLWSSRTCCHVPLRTASCSSTAFWALHRAIGDPFNVPLECVVCVAALFSEQVTLYAYAANHKEAEDSC